MRQTVILNQQKQNKKKKCGKFELELMLTCTSAHEVEEKGHCFAK